MPWVKFFEPEHECKLPDVKTCGVGSEYKCDKCDRIFVAAYTYYGRGQTAEIVWKQKDSNSITSVGCWFTEIPLDRKE